MLGQGWTPLEIFIESRSWIDWLSQPVEFGRAVNASDGALLTEQLSVLLSSGINLDRALQLVGKQLNRPRARATIERVIERVRSGGTLGKALASEDVYPAYALGIIRAAERSGQLATALDDLSIHLRQLETLKQQLVGALTYPVIVLATSVIAVGVVLLGIIPAFAPIFEGEEARLPLLTQIVLGTSNLIVHHKLALLFLVLLCSGVLLSICIHPASRNRLLSIASRAPGYTLWRDYRAGQLLLVLGSLLKHGVTLVESVELARDVTDSARWQAYLQMVGMQLRAGSRVGQAFSLSGRMPELAIRLIEVGERSGELAAMMTKAGELLTKNAKARIDHLVAIVNPAAILILGAFIGLLILGVMLGIFSLGMFVR